MAANVEYDRPNRVSAVGGPVLFLWMFLMCNGCAGPREAFDDRVAARRPTIEFGCDVRRTNVTPLQLPSGVSIYIQSFPDPDPPTVGQLHEWSSDGIPVRIEGRLPSVVLAEDLKEILEAGGFKIVDNPEAAAAILEVQISSMGVGQLPARWYEFRGRIIAQIDISCRLIRGDEVIWKTAGTERNGRRVAYFLTSDVEKELKKAYCSSLKRIEREVRSGDFLSALNR